VTVTVQGRKPKYANHVTRKVRLDLDSFAVLVSPDCYLISDRKNFPHEDPCAYVSLIEYDGRLQLRFAIAPKNVHIEKPSYYTVNPENWKEKAWICIPLEEIEKLKRVCKKVITPKTNLAEVLE